LKTNNYIILRSRYYLSVFVILNLLFQIFSPPTMSHAIEHTLRTETIICEGTDYQTVAYFFSSEIEGPTVMIIAGVHGDELAGIKASKQFMENFEPERGTVIIIPEVNKEACENRVRTMPLEEDLNRVYPGDSKAQDIARLAGELFEIMEVNEIDFLLDLHESIEHYQVNPSHYGQTIILDDDNEPFLREISDYLVNQLNRLVFLPGNYFKVIIEPIIGCSTYEALNRHGIPGITFETSTRIDFCKRVTFHYHCIRNILNYFEIISLSHT